MNCHKWNTPMKMATDKEVDRHQQPESTAPFQLPSPQ